MTKHLADRNRERQLFLQMVDQQIPERILLIEAPSSFGKTELLEQFVEDCPQGVMRARIDLRSAEAGAAYVFWRIREELGRQYFPTFTAEVQQMLHSLDINISRNVVIGQAQIQIALGGDEQARDLRLMALIEAFFQDLRSIERRIVFLFDTYNAASIELQNWLSGAFLAAAVSSPQLFVVVAGQSVPALSFEWRDHCHSHCLDRIEDVEAWHTFARESGLTFELEVVRALTVVFEGNPLRIRSAFDALMRERR